MAWADAHIERLARGETVEFRPRGRSMEPRVSDGSLCRVEPVSLADLRSGDVVLCQVGGSQYLHLVKATRPDGSVLIGNNKGRTNGWTRAVYGRLVRTQPQEQAMSTNAVMRDVPKGEA